MFSIFLSTSTPGDPSCHFIFLLCFFFQLPTNPPSMPSFSATTMFPVLFFPLIPFLSPSLLSSKPHSPKLKASPSTRMPKYLLDSHKYTQWQHAWVHKNNTIHRGVHTGRFTDFDACEQTHTETHTSSLRDPLLVCEPSVHLFQRTNTPDSTEELLSPFHCSLNSTIESTRWRDKLEQKLNAPWGELEIENHCSCPKPFLWESENWKLYLSVAVI